MSKPYVVVEYPKQITLPTGEEIVVESAEAEAAALKPKRGNLKLPEKS